MYKLRTNIYIYVN